MNQLWRGVAAVAAFADRGVRDFYSALSPEARALLLKDRTMRLLNSGVRTAFHSIVPAVGAVVLLRWLVSVGESRHEGAEERAAAKPAGALRRLAAFAVDLCVVGYPLYWILAPAVLRPFSPGPDPPPLLDLVVRSDFIIAANPLLWVYCAAMASCPWQATIGQKALKLSVTDLEGNRVSFWRALARSALLCALFLALAVADKQIWFHPAAAVLLAAAALSAVLVALFARRKQAFHDRLTGCLVVARPYRLMP
ncbi:MAG: RDD family protein [Planctomycetota bacterium]|jgi:uncharacterized RDD family membrane protein YckC